MLRGKHIGKYYRRYWYLFLIGVLVLLATDYVQTLIPESLGQIVDAFNSEPRDGEAVLRISLTVIFVAIGVAVGRFLWRITIFQAETRIEMGLRDDMFSKSMRLSQTYLHENPVGNVLNYFSTDMESVADFVGWGTVMIVDAFFMSTIVIVKMFLINWLLALVIVIPMLFIVGWGALVEKVMTKKWEQRQKSNDEIYDFSQENITGLRVIKAFVKEVQQLRAFSKVARKNKDVSVSFARVSVLFDVMIEVIIGLIMSMALCLGGYLVYRFVGGEPLWGIELSPGELTSLIGFFTSLIWPMMALGMVFAMYSRAKTSMKRIAIFLDAPEDIVSPENGVVMTDVKGKIEFRNLSFTYPDSGKKYLFDISLTINPGEIVGVVGRIGSGKSTLMSLLGRIYNVEKNSILIDDVDIMDAELTSLRSNVAFVMQDNFLFSDTIANNIAFANPNATEEEIVEAAKFASIDQDIAAFPDGYKTEIGERGVTLSGGQKQRVSIARAYLKDAPILILDDSVSAVDVNTEGKILAGIREKRKGKTTILIASRVSTVASLDKIIVLDNGRLEAFGSHAELLKSSPTYAKMVALQELEGEAN